MLLTERIKEVAAIQGHTLASIEREVGFPKSSIRKWDTNLPSCDKLLKVADFLSVSIDYLMKGDALTTMSLSQPGKWEGLDNEAIDLAHEWMKLDERGKAIVKGEVLRRVEKIGERQQDSSEEAQKLFDSADSFYGFEKEEIIPIRMLPVLGRAAAGRPLDMIKHNYGTVPDRGKGGTYAVIAVGESMMDADIHDGDYAVIKQQGMVENGQTALVAVEDGSTIKRFYQFEDHFELRSCNEKHEVQKYSRRTDLRVLGLVVDVIPHNER